jgi:hypothetical protein
VAPDDHGGLQATLLQLMEHPDQRAAMAQRARSVALRHTGAAMATAYISAYRVAAAAAGRCPMKGVFEEQQCVS